MVGERENSRSDVEIVSIEELAPQDHLLRKMDKVLEDEYLYELVRPLYSRNRGRKSIDPVVLIKMVLLQHLNGIRSLRQTVKEVEVNIAYRWFLGMDFHSSIPHFSTISYAFSKRFTSEIFEEIFAWVLEKAIGFGYVEPETVFIDATHIKACANNYKRRKKIAQRAARVYEQQLKEEINSERKAKGKKPFDDDDEPLADREVTQSTSDPESGMFRKEEHKTVVWERPYGRSFFQFSGLFLSFIYEFCACNSASCSSSLSLRFLMLHIVNTTCTSAITIIIRVH